MNARITLALTTLLALVCACCPHPPLRAQSVTWTGPADGDWHTAASWSGGSLPTNANSVAINTAGPVLNSGIGYTNTFDVAGAANSTAVFYLGGNAELNSWPYLGQIGSAPNSLGRMYMSGNSRWLVNGVYLGLSGGVGYLYMTDNAFISSTGFPSLGRSAGGQGFLFMSGNAGIEHRNSFFIGDSGANAIGVLTMSGSSSVTGAGSGEAQLGRNAGTSGTAILSEWAVWRPTRSLMIGEAGSGVLIMSGSSQLVVSGSVFVGDAASGVGSVHMRDSAAMSVTGSLYIGFSGKGMVTLENNVSVRAIGITMAESANSSGTLLITGTKGASITASDGASPITITGGAGSAKIIFDHTDDSYVFANNLAGSLSIEHTGAGLTVLTGNNSCTGGMIVSGGTLAGATASLRGNITNNATVAFHEDLGSTGTFAGVMTGTGVLGKAGAGALELAGDLTAFNGSLVIVEGMVSLGNSVAANLQNVLMAGGVYDGSWVSTTAERAFAGAGTVTGDISVANSTLGIGGNLFASGLLTIGGDLTVADSTLSFGAGAGGSSDSISVLGSVSVSGANTVDITPRGGGSHTYNLGNIGALSSARLTIYGADPTLNPRVSGTLYASGADLMMSMTSDISRALAWTGNANALWNTNAANWSGSESTAQFLPGDTVVFDGASDSANLSRRAITIAPGARNVSDMLVTGAADYIFSGEGGISAHADNAVIDIGNPNGLTAPAGRLLKSGAGALAFENTGGNNFAGGIEISGGAIVFNRADQLGAMDDSAGSPVAFTASGSLVAGADGITFANQIHIDNGATATIDTQSHPVTYTGIISGTGGAFVKRGDGRLTFTDTIIVSSVELAQGDLCLVSTTGLNATSASLQSPAGIVIHQGASLSGVGNVSTSILTNRGAIKVGKAAGAATHGILAIDGDYHGDGGKLFLDISLNAAATGVSHDRLLISGDATGATPVSFQSEPDPRPLPKGFSLPDIADIITVGGFLAPGTFFQDGAVEFGGIEYLWDTKTNQWAPDTSAPAKAMICVDAAATLIGKASFESLQRRLMFTRVREGDINSTRKLELWLGGMARHEKLSGSLYKSATAGTQGAQAGMDWIRVTRRGSQVFGLYLDHAQTDMKLAANTATTKTQATGVGLYSSWGSGVWFVDAMLRRAVENHDIVTRRGNGFLSRGTSWTGAVAAGITLNPKSTWRFEPQAQLIYQRHLIKDATDNFQRVFITKSADLLDARAGVRVWRDIVFGAAKRKFTPYARASVSYEFQGDSTVTVANATFRNNLGGIVGLLDAGAEVALGNRFTLNATVSLFEGAKTSGYSAGAGLRYAW